MAFIKRGILLIISIILISIQEAVNIFLSKCEASGLPVFVLEPSLVRAIRDGGIRRLELWNRAKQNIVTFGVISPGLDQLVSQSLDIPIVDSLTKLVHGKKIVFANSFPTIN